MADIKYSVTNRLGVLSKNENSGWTKEANIIAWNDGAEKLDIREWNPEHTKMSKGITLTKEEAVNLYGALQRLFGR